MAFRWTDELKARVIKQYQDAEPDAKNSMEIVKEIANELIEEGNEGMTPNGVRQVLAKAEVYIKIAESKPTTAKKAADGDKPKRVSKEDAFAGLTAAIEALDLKADSEIIDKLTGKAAVYFTTLFEGLNK